jgi:predicted nucleotidyltransferase
MNIDPIALDLLTTHGCHTAILYGSWARGDATAESDLDLLLVRDEGRSLRDARIEGGVYIDAFVYPRAALVTVEPSLLRILGGRVIRERDGFGTELLERVRELDRRGPEPMPDDERQALVLWAHKMVDRFRNRSGLEPEYRKRQLFAQAIEDYFALRNAWFRGPKPAFAWLRDQDPDAHACFERAARPDATDADFDALVRAVYG